MEAMPANATPDLIAAALGDLTQWRHRCHAASLRLVRSGALPTGSRVARGVTTHLGGQHSWVVVGDGTGLADPYARDAVILDPTAWSYQDGELATPAVWAGQAVDYTPHGATGNDARLGLPRPASYADVIQPDEAALAAAPAEVFMFFARNGSLDHHGWWALMRCSVDTYPASAMLALMMATPALRALVPVDVLGMATTANPGELYF